MPVYNESITIEITKLSKVTMIPGFRNSKKPIFTPSFSADSITIRLAIAPMIVALPASVDADARLNHSRSLPAALINGNITIVKGTLLTI